MKPQKKFEKIQFLGHEEKKTAQFGLKLTNNLIQNLYYQKLYENKCAIITD